MKKVLVVGGRGQLAQALVQAAPAGVECVAVARPDVDILNEATVAAALEKHQPHLVINGAAYNLVDLAETTGMDDALAINAQGPAHLARACRLAGVPLVHFSTDFVFDGHKSAPYTEQDATGPLGVYAASKLAGENLVLAASDANYAIRVCRLFGPVPAQTGAAAKPAGSFPLLMQRLGRERASVRVVSDQIGTPSYTPDVARGVWELVAAGQPGLYHVTNAGEVSFADYAREVFAISNIECQVESVTSAEYGAAARRPLYSTLCNARAEAAGITPLRHWRDALVEFLAGAG